MQRPPSAGYVKKAKMSYKRVITVTGGIKLEIKNVQKNT